MRAAFPMVQQLTKESTNEGKALKLKPCRELSCATILQSNNVGGLECVFLSTTERYELDCFIGQYIKTRNLQSYPTIGVLRAALETIPVNIR